ncbi:hypothetical protein PR202_gb20850 [Eleusine coracana subsp. coracana]|uniref:Transmembrane protein 135 N-terminal domain-containing protein n=1 Tax=Eleusine coracana subsp. coracana TaxID=191504 RepID=A0AAV5FCI9_ELECO|nr:hypothetical protein PR202_gb20850 [Eleusine coracana subsp. coracana]
MPFLSTPSFDLSAGAEPTLGPSPAPVPPSPPAPASAAHPQVSEAAARRLREAEERLREAIEELHRHQGGGGEGKEGEEHHGDWGCGHDGESCAAHAAGNLCQSFLLSYGVRVGIGILLRAFKLARRKSYGSLLDLKFLESPASTCWRALVGAVRSTTFLSAFVTLFQTAICLHRKVAVKDHKLVYWFAGLVSGLSILLEKKVRRAELALYVLPRAGDSLWNILINRHLLPNVKNAEVALFCMCMGGIMYFLEYEPDTMAPFLRGLIKRFLASKISNPSPPPNRNASYLQTLNALEQSRPQSGPENGTVTSEKYNLESIPGL